MANKKAKAFFESKKEEVKSKMVNKKTGKKAKTRLEKKQDKDTRRPAVEKGGSKMPPRKGTTVGQDRKPTEVRKPTTVGGRRTGDKSKAPRKAPKMPPRPSSGMNTRTGSRNIG